MKHASAGKAPRRGLELRSPKHARPLSPTRRALEGAVFVGVLSTVAVFGGVASSSTPSGSARSATVGALSAATATPVTLASKVASTSTTTTTAATAAAAEATEAPPAPATPVAALSQTAPAPVAAAAPAADPAPVPAPAPAAAPEPAAPVAELAAPAAPPAPSGGSVEDAIATYFGDVYDKAVRVARCESTLNPSAVSPGGGNFGLFQINTAHRGLVASMGYSWDQLLDPYVNSAVARRIFDSAGGWGPWGCRGA